MIIEGECEENETINESSYLTEYDENFCYEQTGLSSDNWTNITYWDYQLAPCQGGLELLIVSPKYSCDGSIYTLQVSFNANETINLTYEDGEGIHNLTYYPETGYYEYIPNLTGLVYYGIDVNTTYENRTYYASSYVRIQQCYDLTIHLWEQVDSRLLYNTSDIAITEENYNKELIDPYINDFGYIIARSANQNASGEYKYCNVPFGSGQKLLGLFDFAKSNLTDGIKPFVGCEEYWFRSDYYNGEAVLTLPFMGNYSLYFIDGIINWENNVSPPEIVKSNLFMPLGEIDIPSHSNFTLDIWISHDELNFYSSWTDGVFLFMVTIFPFLLFIALVLIKVPIQIAGFIVIAFEGIWIIQTMLF